MIQERQRGLPKATYQRDELPTLFTALVTAEDAKARFDAVAGIVTHTFEDNFDVRTFWMTLYRGSNLALKQPNRQGERNLGMRVLAGLGQHFQERGITHKIHLDMNKKFAHSFTQVHSDQVAENLEKLQTDPIFPPQIPQALEAFSLLDEVSSRGGIEQLAAIIKQACFVGVTEENSEAYGKLVGEEGVFFQIMHLVDEARPEARADPKKVIQLPEKLIGIAQETSGKYRVDGIPDIYTTQFNGFSLQEVIASVDQEEFNQRALLYVSGIPRGDIFWQKFIDGIFFNFPPVSAMKQETQRQYLDQEFGKRILLFMYSLSNSVLYPAFHPEVKDEAFDLQFQELLECVDGDRLRRVAAITFSGIELPLVARKIFDAEVVEIPERSIAAEAYGDIALYPTSFRRDVTAARTRSAIAQHHSASERSIRKRFSEFKHIGTFIDYLRFYERNSEEQGLTPSAKDLYASLTSEQKRQYQQLLRNRVENPERSITSGKGGKGEWYKDTDQYGEEFVYWIKHPTVVDSDYQSVQLYSYGDGNGYIFTIKRVDLDWEIIGRIDNDNNVSIDIPSIGRDETSPEMDKLLAKVARDAVDDLSEYMRRIAEERMSGSVSKTSEIRETLERIEALTRELSVGSISEEQGQKAQAESGDPKTRGRSRRKKERGESEIDIEAWLRKYFEEEDE